MDVLLLAVVIAVGYLALVMLLIAGLRPLARPLGQGLFYLLIAVTQLCAAAVGLLAALPAALLGSARSQLTTVWRTMATSKARCPDRSSGAEPAYPAYFGRPGWDELRNVWDAVGEEQRQLRERGRMTAERAFTGGSRHRFFAFGLGGARFGIALTTPVAWLLRIGASALHLMAYGAGFVLWTVMRAGAAAAERLARRLRGVRLACPHLDCGQAMVLPVHLCPACGAEHHALAPNCYGAVRHTCRCGARLPAAALFGAHRLEARCPSCDKALPRRTTRTRLRMVVLVGGPRSGRSTIRSRATAQIRDRAEALGGRFRTEAPEPYAADLNSLRGPGALLALLDPPGAAFGTQQDTDTLGCLGHADGLLLVIDPLALPQVKRSLGDEDRKRIRSVPVSTEDPVRAVERVLHVVRAMPAARRPRRIAVVLSKSGVIRLTSAGARLGDSGDVAVRRWLDESGSGNLLRTVATSGARVRYAATGEGGTDSDSTALGDLVLWAAGARVARRSSPVRDRRTAQDQLADRLERAQAAAERCRRMGRLLTAHENRWRKRAELLGNTGSYTKRRPDGWVPGGRQGAPPLSLIAARRGLLLSHLAGFIVVPLTLALLFSGSLPSAVVDAAENAYHSWFQPLFSSVKPLVQSSRWTRVQA